MRLGQGPSTTPPLFQGTFEEYIHVVPSKTQRDSSIDPSADVSSLGEIQFYLAKCVHLARIAHPRPQETVDDKMNCSNFGKFATLNVRVWPSLGCKKS